ncbi:MAG: hypothetical protein H6Q20_2647 [Bacteroidetes bacterium]|nr:hypothetical protein [Bacteroidota bacterium]
MNETRIIEQEHSEPINIADVSGSSFIKAIKELDTIAYQAWIDKRGWLLLGNCKYHLQVWIYENHATISPQGYGSCQPLIARTPDELKECCKMWWRNR